MKRVIFLLICIAMLAISPALVAAPQPLSPELQKLDISIGRWIYHGKTMPSATNKGGSWTWNADCRWSGNMVFLECSFTNDWAGKIVKSLVVDTYNGEDQTYWHYEMFATGAKGDKPFVSKMAIHGNTWIEYGQEAARGKKIGERIVYRWQSPTRVSVAIEISRDGVHWKTVDQGEGVKQP